MSIHALKNTLRAAFLLGAGKITQSEWKRILDNNKELIGKVTEEEKKKLLKEVEQELQGMAEDPRPGPEGTHPGTTTHKK
jgi:hypothetical protein